MRHAAHGSPRGGAGAAASGIAAGLKPARLPVQRPADARLLVVARDGTLSHRARAGWVDALHPHDLVVANDAATLPASLFARHVPTARTVELRLAAHAARAHDGAARFAVVAFGEGDWRTPTEARPAPPPLTSGDALVCGDARLVVDELLGHPRLVLLRFPSDDAAVWALVARAGKPVQYAHLAVPLAAWDVATPLASRPVAFEAPSAGFALDWRAVQALRARRIPLVTLTHAAGLSSTGDAALDAALPLDEPYDIPAVTAQAVARARATGGRVVAIGTTVVRALEHAGRSGSVAAGRGVATQRIGPGTRTRIVDALLTGTHAPGTSHYELLRALAPDAVLFRAAAALAAHGYRTHEFGDSILIERAPEGRTSA